MPPKSSTGFNYNNYLLQSEYIGFDNKESRSVSITKGIKITNKTQTIFNALGKMVNGKFETEYQVFLIDKNVKRISFNLREDKKLTSGTNAVINISDVYATYETYKKKAYNIETDKAKEELKLLIDYTFHQFDSMYRKGSGWYNDYLQKLNKYYYYGLMVVLNKDSSVADEFIARIVDPIVGRGFSFLLFSNARYLNSFEDIFSSNQQYLSYLAMGAFLFLKNEGSKSLDNYESAKKWFFSSAWYKANKEEVDKAFISVSNIEFKNYVKKLSFTNTKGQVLTMRQIINQHPSPYYLLDFWATWCKPCIEGAKIIKEKGVPAKVKVLSLSLDRPNRKEKWQEMTQELQQDYTYWVKEDANLKAFVDALKLQAIPRYILVDGEFNIVDNAFYAPYEPKFLSTLESLK